MSTPQAAHDAAADGADPADPAEPADGAGATDAAVAALAREAQLLVQRLRLWTGTRWAAAGRAELAHHLAAWFAELEGAAPGPLPRLGNDLLLPDQLAVTADDLVRSRPPREVARAATAHLLLHRRDLLGDEVPAGLAASLGFGSGPEVLAAGRAACSLPDAGPGSHG